MKESLNVLVVPVGAEPYELQITPDDNQSTLRSLQNCVGGHIDILDQFNGTEIILHDEGLINGMPPNRAVFATPELVEAGGYSQINHQKMTSIDDLRYIVHGDFVLARFDEEGNTTSLTQADIDYYKKEFSDPLTGYFSAICIDVEADDLQHEFKIKTLRDKIKHIHGLFSPLAMDDLLFQLQYQNQITREECGYEPYPSNMPSELKNPPVPTPIDVSSSSLPEKPEGWTHHIWSDLFPGKRDHYTKEDFAIVPTFQPNPYGASLKEARFDIYRISEPTEAHPLGIPHYECSQRTFDNAISYTQKHSQVREQVQDKAPRLGDTQKQSTDASRELNSGRTAQGRDKVKESEK